MSININLEDPNIYRDLVFIKKYQMKINFIQLKSNLQIIIKFFITLI